MTFQATQPMPAEPIDFAREDARLAALDQFDILDTPREEGFDRITRLARKMFRVPVAIVSFIDAHRQWYKSAEGTPTLEVPRDQTFCKRVVAAGDTLVCRMRGSIPASPKTRT